MRFVDCGQKCNEPYITSNTPSCLIPELTSCSSNSQSSYSGRNYGGGHGGHRGRKYNCYDNDGVICFKTMLLNLKDVTTNGQTDNVVTIDIRKKNNVVTLQWEPFTATTAVDKASYYAVAQGIRNMPNYPVTGPYLIKVGNSMSYSTVVIDPNGGNQIRFYYTADMNGTTNINTVIEVPGGTVNWISKC